MISSREYINEIKEYCNDILIELLDDDVPFKIIEPDKWCDQHFEKFRIEMNITTFINKYRDIYNHLVSYMHSIGFKLRRDSLLVDKLIFDRFSID